MRVRVILAVCLFGFAVAAGFVQDPKSRPASRSAKPPQPPADAPPLPPIESPVTVPRTDLRPRFGPRSPLVGVWRLVRMTGRGGVPLLGARGWMSLTDRHLFLHLQVGSPKDRQNATYLQSGVYRWRVSGSALTTTALAAHKGNTSLLAFDEPGRTKRRSFSLGGGGLQVFQSSGERMEFVRVE